MLRGGWGWWEIRVRMRMGGGGCCSIVDIRIVTPYSTYLLELSDVYEVQDKWGPWMARSAQNNASTSPGWAGDTVIMVFDTVLQNNEDISKNGQGNQIPYPNCLRWLKQKVTSQAPALQGPREWRLWFCGPWEILTLWPATTKAVPALPFLRYCTVPPVQTGIRWTISRVDGDDSYSTLVSG